MLCFARRWWILLVAASVAQTVTAAALRRMMWSRPTHSLQQNNATTTKMIPQQHARDDVLVALDRFAVQHHRRLTSSSDSKYERTPSSDRPSSVKSSCEADRTAISDYCYQRVLSGSTFAECETECHALAGGRLPCPRNSDFYDDFFRASGHKESTWAPLTDQTTEGQFIVVDPECPPDFDPYWQSGEPNNHRNKEDCSVFTNEGGRMNDLNCASSDKPACLCEFDPSCAADQLEWQNRCYEAACPSNTLPYQDQCHSNDCPTGTTHFHGRCVPVPATSVNDRYNECRASCGGSSSSTGTNHEDEVDSCAACESLPVCPAGFDHDYEDQCFQNAGTVSGYDACQAECDAQGAMMLCVYSEDLSAWLGAQFGATAANPALLLGLRDRLDKGAFRWDDPRCTADLWNWDRIRGEPQPDGGACTVNDSAGWRTARCDQPATCVCQRPMENAIYVDRMECGKAPDTCFPKYCVEEATDNPSCWTKPFQDNPHQMAHEYKIVRDYKDWNAHIADADQWGGNLASLTSAAESNMVSGSIVPKYPYKTGTSPLPQKQMSIVDSGLQLTAEECQDYCISTGADVPCLDGEAKRQLDSLATQAGEPIFTGYKRGDGVGWMNKFCTSSYGLNYGTIQSSDQIFVVTSNAGFEVVNPSRAHRCACVTFLQRIDLFWIGLHRESSDLPWVWTDGTLFDVDKDSKWKSGCPSVDIGPMGATLLNNRYNKWIDDGNLAGTRPAVYKRNKQQLTVGIVRGGVADATNVKLLPGVPFVSALQTARVTNAGSYKVLKNGYELEILGSETILYAVEDVKRAVEAGYTVNFEFNYEITGEGCKTTVCVTGNCKSLVQGAVSIPAGSSENFLVFQQFCDTTSSQTVSLWKEINFEFGGCPEGTTLVLDDEKFLFPECQCPHNYVSLTSFNRILSSVSDSCTESSRLDFNAQNTIIEMQIVMGISASFKSTDWFAVAMWLGNPSRDTVDTRGLKIIKSKPSGTVAGLEPGRRYLISLTPYTNPETLVEDLTVVGSVVTPCTCGAQNQIFDGERQNSEDLTGKPTDLELTQLNGHITFKFRDQSMCEDSYAFTREAGTGSGNPAAKESFTPNYYFYSENRCAKNKVDPGLKASDDLMISQLIVGEPYTYCIRATAFEYMHHPSDASLPSLSSSDEACWMHVIHFEASIHGEVILEPNAGAIPVPDAVVSWQLLDPSDTSKVVLQGTLEPTGPSGTFQIKIMSVDDILDNHSTFPVKIKVSKTTVHGNSTIQHTFECNNGTIDCGNDGTTIYVRHLDLEKPLQVVDTTAVPFRGLVVVEGTSQGGNDPGCPIMGADVCLVDKTKLNSQKNTEGIAEYCVKTDSNGLYELGAVIGTKVSVKIGYFEHEFQPVEQEYRPYSSLLQRYEQGVHIEADGIYEDWDFKDVTTAMLFVDVAGGLCNKTLGTSRLELSISGGCEWSTELTQDHFRGSHVVPASIVDIQVIEVVKADGESVNGGAIGDYFLHMDPQTIDIREELKSEDSSFEELGDDDAVANVEEYEQFHVRFEYTGAVITRSIYVSKEIPTNCEMETFAPIEIVGGADSSSLHILPTSRGLAPIILSLEVELIHGELWCDVLGDTKVLVTNNLGPSDADLERWSIELSEKDIEEYSSCKYGCLVDMEHNEDGEEAHVSMIFRLGPPNVFNPPSFLRDVRFEILPQSNPQFKNPYMHVAEFVITGDFEMDPLLTFELPTHNPIMVLRSPPGSASSATYENVETTVRVESAEYEVLVGLNAALGGGLKFDAQNSVCAGLGVQNCIETVEAEAEHVVGLSYEFEKTLDSGGKQFGATFEAAWSYTAAGGSDIFVLPMLSVDFTQVEEVIFDKGACAATNNPTTKFSLKEGEGSTSGLSFVSSEHIEDVVIPDIQFQLDNMDESADTDGRQYEELTHALRNWQKVLNDFAATNDAASDGRLQMAPSNWFDGYYNKYIDTRLTGEIYGGMSMNRNGVNGVGKEVSSGLIPNTLIEKARKFESAPEGEQDLRKANRIKFSGEGGVMTYTLSYSKLEEGTSLKNGASDNEAESFGATLGTGLEATFVGWGFAFSAEANRPVSRSKSHVQSDEMEVGTAVSFELGDEDIYGTDWFNVDVYVDPMYGTFIFNVAGGMSRCPHIEGTEPAAEPFLEVNEFPREHVMPDEPMMFDVLLQNRGPMPSTFQLYVLSEQNIGMLTVLAGGNSLASPLSFSLGGANTDDDRVLMTVAVMRGPGSYKFPALTLGMSVYCGEGGDLGDREETSVVLWNRETSAGQILEFAQPCPPVHWSGALLRDNEFVVKADTEKPAQLDVTVFNPKFSVSGTFSKMVADNLSTRLESVRLKYRRKGRQNWSVARLTVDDTTDEMDYARHPLLSPTENSYGYRTLTWAIGESQVSDGLYDIRMESECTNVDGGEEFNTYVTTSISGIIDRVHPELYGSPLPQGELLLGNEVVFLFTESIRCMLPYTFKLEVTVDGARTHDGFQRVFDVMTTCLENRLAFKFRPDDYSEVMGRTVNVNLEHVQDIAGNEINGAVQHGFYHGLAESIKFDVELAQDCASLSTSTGSKIEALQGQLTTAMGISEFDRLHVQEWRCNVQENTIVATVALSSVSPEGSNRHLSEVDLQSTHDIYWQLRNSKDEGHLVTRVGVPQYFETRKRLPPSQRHEIVRGMQHVDVDNDNEVMGASLASMQILSALESVSGQIYHMEGTLHPHSHEMEEKFHAFALEMEETLGERFEARTHEMELVLKRQMDTMIFVMGVAVVVFLVAFFVVLFLCIQCRHEYN